MLHTHRRDALDKNILYHLQENSRQTTACLSKKLRVARSTIHERIAKLEREGVIVGYTAVVQPEQTASFVQALLFLKVEQSRIGLVSKFLHDCPEVKSCFAIAGEFDLYCSIETEVLEDMDAFIEEIASKPHILQTQSKIVLSKKFDRISNYTNTYQKEENHVS
ncbi:MAG: Lrp/AsnC family transcriptional regulator [Methylocystaceae bacterium]|nr:Lrp/AsnC family transcriptional regulator [Methylocystaceae bacterium]